jgi:hypothetical protein
MQGIKSGLESVGFAPEIKDLDFFQDDYGLGPAPGEGDDSEEDDEDGDDGEDREDEGDDNGIGDQDA